MNIYKRNRLNLSPKKTKYAINPVEVFEERYAKILTPSDKYKSKYFVIPERSDSDKFNNSLANIMNLYQYDDSTEDNKKEDVNNYFPKILQQTYLKEKEEIQKVFNKKLPLTKNLSLPNFHCSILKNYITNQPKMKVKVPQDNSKLNNSKDQMNSQPNKLDKLEELLGTKYIQNLNRGESSIHFRNKPRNLKDAKYFNKQQRITYDIKGESFKSPLEAFNVVKKNKSIFEGMVQNYNNLERDKYISSFGNLNSQLIKQFEVVNSKIKKSPQKIKILQKQKMDDGNYASPSHSSSRNNKYITNLSLQSYTNYNQGNTNDGMYENSGTENNNSNMNNTNNNNTSQVNNTEKKPNHFILLYVKFLTPINYFPSSRYHFVFLNQGNNGVLCGGFVSDKKNIVWKFNGEKMKWGEVETRGLPTDIRYGLSGVIYYNKLVIFGGRMMNTPVIGGVEIFDFNNNEWSVPCIPSYKKFKFRRNHVCELVGSQMFIHGGIDEEGNYLDDCCLLNLIKPMRWMPPSVTGKSPLLAYHSCCLVLEEDIRLNSKMNIYKLPIKKFEKQEVHIKERGLYFFGGKNSFFGAPNNNLTLLRIGDKPLEWCPLETYGMPPCPRYSTSMNFYEEGNCVIIHGGRNDTLNSSEFALNDTFILDLTSLNWIKVEYIYDSGSPKVPFRCAHQAIVNNNKLMIFGGINSSQCLAGDLCIMELTSNKKTINKSNKDFEYEERRNNRKYD